MELVNIIPSQIEMNVADVGMISIISFIFGISGRGEYTDLTVRLPDSGEEGLEVSLELASLLASYSVPVSVNNSLWEDCLA